MFRQVLKEKILCSMSRQRLQRPHKRRQEPKLALQEGTREAPLLAQRIERYMVSYDKQNEWWRLSRVQPWMHSGSKQNKKSLGQAMRNDWELMWAQEYRHWSGKCIDVKISFRS